MKSCFTLLHELQDFANSIYHNELAKIKYKIGNCLFPYGQLSSFFPFFSRFYPQVVHFPDMPTIRPNAKCHYTSALFPFAREILLRENKFRKKLISIIFWAHFAACPKRQNRAIRSNSSTLLTQSLRDFHSYPLRSSRAN